MDPPRILKEITKNIFLISFKWPDMAERLYAKKWSEWKIGILNNSHKSENGLLIALKNPFGDYSQVYERT